MTGTPSDTEWKKALMGLGSLQKRVLQIFASLTPAVDRRLIQLILERTVGNPGSFRFVDFHESGTSNWRTLPPVDSKVFDNSEIDTLSHSNSCLPITFLELSSRALNSLQAGGISSVDALTKLSEQDLIGIDGVGKKATKEIKECLAAKGLFLKVGPDSASNEKHREGVRLKALGFSKREFANREDGRPDIPRHQYWFGTPGGKSFLEVFGREPSKSEVTGLGKALDRLQDRGVLLHSNCLNMSNRKTWQIRLTPLGVEVAAQLLRAEFFGT